MIFSYLSHAKIAWRNLPRPPCHPPQVPQACLKGNYDQDRQADHARHHPPPREPGSHRARDRLGLGKELRGVPGHASNGAGLHDRRRPGY